MILITCTTTGLLIQRDATEIAIAAPAVPLALGPIIHELIDSGRAIAAARLDAYNRGLHDGREHERIERETSERCAARKNADDLAELMDLAPATLAA